jgi:hypothetical protein
VNSSHALRKETEAVAEQSTMNKVAFGTAALVAFFGGMAATSVVAQQQIDACPVERVLRLQSVAGDGTGNDGTHDGRRHDRRWIR